MKCIKSACLVSAMLLTLANGTAVIATESPASITDMASKATEMMDKININTADLESLAKIPGLPKGIGEAIVAYRDAHGAFKSLTDLVNIEGIDARLLEKIKPFISL